MVAINELPLPTLEAADKAELVDLTDLNGLNGLNNRFVSWSTSKNIGILILTLVVLTVVSGICIHYVLTPSQTVEVKQRQSG